jgi:predicted NACHT family NTPase
MPQQKRSLRLLPLLRRPSNEAMLKKASLSSEQFRMSKKIYDWKRFWCPRNAQIDLSDRGYLVDPESEWGRYGNSELVRLETVADTRCLILLGEPGIGKSRAIQAEQKVVTSSSQTDAQKHLILDLHSYGSEDRLVKNLFESSQFRDWVKGEHSLFIYLDSLDECLLRLDNVTALLAEEFRQYQDKIERLFLRIACRTAVWQSNFEEQLKQIWGEDEVKIYELAPLRQVDVRHAAEREGLNKPDLFMQEIRDKKIVPLAIKPVTLGFLLTIYCRNGRFAENQTLCDLYLEGCRILCDEEDDTDPRLPGHKGNLELDQRLSIAARIAAVTVFANRDAVWTGRDRGQIPADDVLRQELSRGYERANERQFEASEAAIVEVLNTGLFSSRGLNRMGWAHQTYAEFLAAWYLKQHNLSLSQILSLILHPDGRVIPQLQETVAWLASMRSDVFQEVMKTDPDVLLQSDITNIDDEIKAKLVESLLILHNEEKLEYSVSRRYNNLQHADLAERLKLYIRDSTKGQWSRLAAIDIAETCKVQSVQTHLADIALDSNQPYWVRVRASRAVKSIGDESTKAKLKPLIFNYGDDDPEDELRGYALRSLYPSQLTAKDVFLSLTQPKAKFVGGTYQDFLAKEVGEYLQESDLLAALKWLEKQPILRDLRYPFTRLSDRIMLKAWQYLDVPEILEGFARVAYLRIQAYDQVVGDSEEELKKSLGENAVKRRQLLEAIIALIPSSEGDPYYLAGQSFYGSVTVLDCDFSWLIERFQSLDTEKAQRIYARLIQLKLNKNDVEQISNLVEACKISSILKAEFSQELEPIELDSSKAREARQQYLDNLVLRRSIEERRPLLEPSPTERVLGCLALFESGQTSAWWQLCREMTLMPNSQHYNDEWESDLTTLPGWKEADNIIRTRIIVAAKQYIFSGQPETESWFGSTSFYYSALAGYKALHLVFEKEPEFIHKTTPEIWKKWTTIILSYPKSNSDTSRKYHEHLMFLAYEKAPDEFIKGLIVLINKENTQHGVRICDQLDCCWDERLEITLLTKMQQDENLTAQSVGALLQVLLAKQVDQAKTFAESLIPIPLPATDKARELAIVAAQMLIRHTRNAGWSVIWKAIQSDLEFGRAVLESVSFEHEFDAGLEHRLDEDRVADLYLFLVEQYPDDDKIQNKGEISNKDSIDMNDYIIEAKDAIRRWKNNIPQRLQARGTSEACDALRKMIRKLPEQREQLQPRLLEAESVARRNTWKPPKPEEILQLTANQELSIPNAFKKIEQLMTEQSHPNFSGATFNAPVNFAPNYGNQAQTLNVQNTEQNFEVALTDFKQFINDLQIQHPNVNTPQAATQTIIVQAKKLEQPRLQNFMSLKRLWNGSKKAGLKVGEHFAESNVWGKGAIAFLEGVSEDV